MDESSQPDMDRMSNLPNEILEHQILDRLTVQKQARTSVLSKAWRSRWLSLTTLVPKFTLHVSTIKPSIHYNIDNIITLLASRSVQELTLGVEGYTVSATLFNLPDLTMLVLVGCWLMHSPPPTASFSGFTNLTKVVLFEVKLGVDLNKFVSRWCPVLTKLAVYWCENVIDFVVDAGLEGLGLESDFRSIWFKNTPALKQLRVEPKFELQFPNVDVAGSRRYSMFRRIFGRLPALEDVWIGSEFREYLAIGGLPHMMINSLKRISLTDQHMYNMEEVRNRHYEPHQPVPNLEELRIHFKYEWVEGTCYDSEFIESLVWGYSVLVLEHLKNVTLVEFTGDPAEMKLVQMLLIKAPVMEELWISTAAETTGLVKSDIIEHIKDRDYDVLSPLLTLFVDGVVWGHAVDEEY